MYENNSSIEEPDVTLRDSTHKEAPNKRLAGIRQIHNKQSSRNINFIIRRMLVDGWVGGLMGGWMNRWRAGWID